MLAEQHYRTSGMSAIAFLQLGWGDTVSSTFESSQNGQLASVMLTHC
jgi:hypothetical protein